MKKIILMIFLTICFSDVQLKKNYGAISSGILGEKIPLTFLDLSYIHEYDNKSELYATLGTMIFTVGIGLGYKYYFIDRDKFTPFVSSTFCMIGGGDRWESLSGFSLASGLNFSIPNWIPSLMEIMVKQPLNSDNSEKKINIGATLFYNFDGIGGILPFLNMEIKLK